MCNLCKNVCTDECGYIAINNTIVIRKEHSHGQQGVALSDYCCKLNVISSEINDPCCQIDHLNWDLLNHVKTFLHNFMSMKLVLASSRIFEAVIIFSLGAILK